jgi:hypothetical protein
MTTSTKTLVGTPDKGEITVKNPDVLFTARGVELECTDHTTGEKVIMVITAEYLPYVIEDLMTGTDMFGRMKREV